MALWALIPQIITVSSTCRFLNTHSEHSERSQYRDRLIDYCNDMLSSRGTQYVNLVSNPWRYLPGQDYDPEKNPDGLISLGLAENVRFHLLQVLSNN